MELDVIRSQQRTGEDGKGLSWLLSLCLVMQSFSIEPSLSGRWSFNHLSCVPTSGAIRKPYMFSPATTLLVFVTPQMSKIDCSLRTPRSVRMGIELARHIQALLASLALGTTRYCIAMSYSAASLQSSPRQWSHRCMSPRQSHAGRTRWPRLPSTAKETEQRRILILEAVLAAWSETAAENLEGKRICNKSLLSCNCRRRRSNQRVAACRS
ncbi:hypothetical protein CABS01_02712 [Colletotrichum abscissum]|uniref:uncharacterized protein n=1 Tax=Colletotrichum abscissum TaxID=1671311 RepID=UPI0027D65CE6|nr:uncharacterized protein CABS01_02712 [Colletotrichum abscissum]KAK1482976.1 hypothetical protein CABS01_02712 [Colletotrichum abscissum]